MLALLASALAFSVVTPGGAAEPAPAAVRRPLEVASRTAVPRTPTAVVMNLVLTEENAEMVLEKCMSDLGTLFGSNAESLNVGMCASLRPSHTAVRAGALTRTPALARQHGHDGAGRAGRADRRRPFHG